MRTNAFCKLSIKKFCEPENKKKKWQNINYPKKLIEFILLARYSLIFFAQVKKNRLKFI